MAALVLARAAPLILVVDDEPDIREMIAEMLLLDGYRIKTAPNGKVALEQARVNRPDLIVLDLMMPVMNGWRFLEAQRQDPGLAAVPVVVATAALVSQVEGAAVLLGKPFDMDVLLSIVARLCAGGPEHLDAMSA
jgi:two-component system, chemotaxis family, chemotaxis protein CheY